MRRIAAISAVSNGTGGLPRRESGGTRLFVVLVNHSSKAGERIIENRSNA